MNLQELRYLVAIAEHRHFGRAAESCNVSQPTLSSQIKKLEDELGVTLLERTSREALSPWPLVTLYSPEFAGFLTQPIAENPAGQRVR